MRLLLFGLLIGAVGCGQALAESGSQGAGLDSGASGACLPLDGVFTGYGTVTAVGPVTQCGAEVGDVSEMGVEFRGGEFRRWVNAGDFNMICHTTQAGCAISVQCSNGYPPALLNLNWDLTIQPDGSLLGEYRLSGTGVYCPDYRATVSYNQGDK